MEQNNMEHNVSLTVIVPCYNVEKYLDDSLKSLEQQWDGRTDYEIILVNDASQDGTIHKLNQFKEKYPDNVVIIDKQVNQGVSAARNSALDIARGKWVTFFDPDDVLVHGGYARLLELTEQGGFDILRFGVVIVNDESVSESPIASEPFRINWKGGSLDYMLDNSFGISTAYLYKREVLGDNRFQPLTICEDTVFNLPILLADIPIAKTESKVYYYIVRPSSATTTINPAKLSRHSDDIFKAINILEDFKEGRSEEMKSRLTKHQWIFSPNLLTRLLLSDQKVSDIKPKLEGLSKLSLFPLQGSGLMSRLMNMVYQHLWLLPLVRPVYRLYRNRS